MVEENNTNKNKGLIMGILIVFLVIGLALSSGGPLNTLIPVGDINVTNVVNIVTALINDTLTFDDGATITDNGTCLILRSPSQSDQIQLCDNNSIHFFSAFMETIMFNSTFANFNVDTNINGTLTANTFIGGGIFWQQNATDLFYDDPTRNVFIEKNLSVADLIIRDQNSLHIGGLDFATISAGDFFDQSLNQTRIFVQVDRDFLEVNNYSGTSYMTNVNNNEDENSSSVVSAGDIDANGMILQKYNEQYRNPFWSVVAARFGDMSILQTHEDTKSNGSNRTIGMGFYDDLELLTPSDFSIIGYNGVDYKFKMNKTNIWFYNDTEFKENITVQDTAHMNNSIVFRHLNSTEAPGAVSNSLQLYAKDDNKLYIKRDTGVERKLVDAGGGSILLDEPLIITNTTQFTTLSGDGDAFACLNGTGYLFRSNTAC